VTSTEGRKKLVKIVADKGAKQIALMVLAHVAPNERRTSEGSRGLNNPTRTKKLQGSRVEQSEKKAPDLLRRKIGSEHLFGARKGGNRVFFFVGGLGLCLVFFWVFYVIVSGLVELGYCIGLFCDG